MVIVEGAISHRAFHHQVQITQEQLNNINNGLAKAEDGKSQPGDVPRN